MYSHNSLRVYPPYAFDSSQEAEFLASVHEMADTLGAEIQIYPACFERGQRFRDVNDMANTLGASDKWSKTLTKSRTDDPQADGIVQVV